MTKATRGRYTLEFKQEAVRLVESAGRTWLVTCLGLILMTVAAASVGCGGGGATFKPVGLTHQVTSSGVVTLIVQ